MWLEVLLFIPLAVICNTAFPIPFDPIFLLFSASQNASTSILFAIVGAICAGLAAVIDFRLAFAVSKNRIQRQSPPVMFYVLLFLCALLPLPFSLVRISLLKWFPRLLLYVGIVMAGRLPRYLLLVYVGETLPLTQGALLTVIIPLCVYLGWKLLRRKSISPGLFFSG